MSMGSMKGVNFTENEKIKIVREFLIKKKTYQELYAEYGVTQTEVQEWSRKYDFIAQTKEGYLPVSFDVSKVSVHLNREGLITNQWLQAKPDNSKRRVILETWAEGILEKIEPIEATKAPEFTEEDLLTTYIITDYHFGMFASELELGEGWDVDKAEKLLWEWFSSAIQYSPNSDTAVIAQLGDFMHFDSLSPVTPTNHHVLDASERYQPLIRIAIRIMRRIVEMLLEKHKHVHLIWAEGNHDESTAPAMAIFFDELYRKEERFSVDCNALPFYAYEWGNTSLFFHHGHKLNMNNVAETVTSIFRELHGRTKYSYVHLGHRHHKELRAKQFKSVIIEQHQTLAPADAYSARLGFGKCERGAKFITYSKKYGEVSHNIIRPEMILD